MTFVGALAALVIAESAVSCIGFVIEGTLVAPPFCNILASTTLRRAFELAPSLGTSILPGGVAQRCGQTDNY